MIHNHIFKVTGMGCGGCANRVKNALSFVEGVSEVEVNLAEGTVMVCYDQARISIRSLIERIEKVGYGAHSAVQGVATDRASGRHGARLQW